MYKDELEESIEKTMAINTHCHHYKNEFFRDLDLDKLLRSSYVNWCGVPFDESSDSKKLYLDKVRFNSYFVWLQKSLKKIYRIEEGLTAKNWDMYSDKIKIAHSDGGWHKRVLKDFCRYEKIIVDTRWDPGSNNDEPDIFASTFRVDPLFFGFSQDAFDHDSNNAFKFYQADYKDLDSYLLFVKNLITRKLRGGCVSIKCAIAYDRPLRFQEVTKEEASKVFNNGDFSKEDIRKFQDYLFNYICDIAAEQKTPLQCHTGLACLDGTNAINLLKTIKGHPETKFVLFHGSFPWTDDLLGLLHVHPNVYTDICWLPLISPSAAEYALNQMIEVGTADKICWGCDTWTSEESYGARIAINFVLTNVLTKKISDGYIDLNDAKQLVENVLYSNPKALYKL